MMIIGLLLNCPYAFGATLIQDISPDTLFRQYQNTADAYQRKAEYRSLDSIAQLMIELGESTDDPSFTHQGYYYKANSYIKTDPQKTVEYAEKALAYFEKIGDEYKVARIANGIGNGLSGSGQYKDAIAYFSRAIKSSKNSKDADSPKQQLFRAYAKTNIAAAYLNFGNYAEAAIFVHQGIETGQLLNDTMLLYTNNNLLGHLKITTENYKSAIQYYKKALKVILPKRPSSAAFVMSGLASAHMKLNEADSALYYFNQLIPNARQSKNNVALKRDLNNVILLYIQIEQYENAIKAANELSELAERSQNKNSQINAYLSLAKIYNLKGQLRFAKSNIDKALALLDQSDKLSITSEIHKYASQIYEQLGKYQTALHHQKTHKSFADSLFNTESRAKVEQLNVTYETKEKEETIKRLELQSALDKNIFRQRVSYFIAGITTLLLLGALVAFLFNRKKLKLINQKNSIEQRLLRSQMNPHFIFNAISSIQNYLYDKNDLKVALTYMSKFAELMRQILENSREESIPLTSEIKSLENYLELQQLRYNNSFGYEIIIDPSINPNNILVPPLIAQPFVENAIEHGMIYRVENGKVQISINSSYDQLTLVVQDNGIGFKAINIEPKKVFNKKTSLATTITKERLGLISTASKKKFDLIIDKLQAGGTIVTIQLPKVSAI